SVEKFSLGEHEYTFRAETNIDFLFWDIRSVIESKYRNHQLWSACAKEKVNGKDKDCTQTIWTDNAYQITKNKAKSVSKELILYSVVMLYHHEPQQLSRIFAERHTKYCTIKEVTPHCYELTAPNGDKNYYSYENGICKEMQTCIMMKTIKFVLVKR
ncbi:MAG: hypothetical protein MUE81_13165, partial [Thermoflexibacter sp.]|nr:hypothetical protein [Thermoflexibacter sp.]